MRKIEIVIIAFSLILLIGGSPATSANQKFQENVYTVVYFMGGFPFGYGASDFFDTKTDILGGKKRRIKASPLMGVGTKYYVNDHFRVDFSVDYFYSSYNDSYLHEVELSTRNEHHSVVDDITISNMPFILSLEYVPHNQQYNTYLGAGAGFSTGQLLWEETVSSPVVWDRRTGGTIFDENLTSPTFRFYSGVELAFDKDEFQYFLGNLLIEFRYTYIFRGQKLLEKFKKQYVLEHPEFDEKYSFIPFYLSLNIGVTLNFNKNVLNKEEKQGQ